MIQRQIEPRLREQLFKGKALIVMGARQVGKTTLLKQVLAGCEEGVLWLSGDDQDVRTLFETISAPRLRAIAGKNRLIVLDEAQRIRDIGIKLKLITDQMPDFQLLATGSSSFELANKINEPLTGRKREHRLFPLSFAEMVGHTSLLEEKRMLGHRLVYGAYPEVVMHPGDEIGLLRELTDSYLYKDILEFDKIHKPERLTKLLQALAYQLGSEVSYNELAQLCGMDAKTVESYITLLEQSYVLFRLGSFSRNLRNELKSSKKIYFYDNGVRNAVIGNFAQVENRMDAGALFENYVVSECMKRKEYTGDYAHSWFWRTTAKQEIDYLEEKDGLLHAFELKWNPRRRATAPLSFRNAYPDADFTVIHRDNIEDLLLFRE
ncbi:MAG: ATP-binding protein [Bacteroidales bacterium]|nr:ATP-binding protein [Bacteroidales bacterium]